MASSGAKRFFVSAFFWIVLIYCLMALVSYSLSKLVRIDPLDAIMAVAVKSPSTRNYLLGGISAFWVILLFVGGIGLQKQTKC